MEYSVIVPVFDERESVPLLHERILRAMNTTGAQFEVIYVDDHSGDGSLEELRAIRERSPFVRVISLAQRRGKSAALAAGFSRAGGKWIILIDADLQNDPADIPFMLRSRGECDLVHGIRAKRKDTLLRKISSEIAHAARKAVLKDVTVDTGCGLSLFRREVLDAVHLFDNFHRFIPYLARTHGFRVTEVPVSHHPRKFGRSKYSTLGRLMEGISDLWGVWWLEKRRIKYEVREDKNPSLLP